MTCGKATMKLMPAVVWLIVKFVPAATEMVPSSEGYVRGCPDAPFRSVRPDAPSAV